MGNKQWIQRTVRLCFALVSVLLLALSVSAEAAEEDASSTNTYSYYLDSDTGCLTITGNGEMGNVGIDTTQKGYKFVSNRPWALTKAKAKKIKSINIGSGITAIPAGAFANLPNLKRVQMPDTVASIGKYAFYGCTSLKTVQIPDNVKIIGKEAFYGCRKLTSVSLGKSVSSIGNRAFFGTKSLCSITIDSANKNFTVKADAIYSKNKKTLYAYAVGISGTARIAKTVVRIKSGAFAYGTFSKITIPSAVKVIESGAFYYCKNLKKVKFRKKSACRTLLCYYKNYGNGVTERLGTFEGCSLLKTFQAPQKLRSMGAASFKGCKALRKVTLPSSFQYFLTDKKKKTKNLNKTSLKGVKVIWNT